MLDGDTRISPSPDEMPFHNQLVEHSCGMLITDLLLPHAKPEGQHNFRLSSLIRQRMLQLCMGSSGKERQLRPWLTPQRRCLYLMANRFSSCADPDQYFPQTDLSRCFQLVTSQKLCYLVDFLPMISRISPIAPDPFLEGILVLEKL
jgi:hypothetical protein